MKVATTILESPVANFMLHFLCQAAAMRMVAEWGKSGDWAKGGAWGKGDWGKGADWGPGAWGKGDWFSHADTASSGLLSNHA